MSPARSLILLTTDFRPMIGGVAEHLHNVAESMIDRAAVTVMTPVQSNGTRWPHGYRLERLPPVPQRRLGERLGDGFAPLRKVQTAAYFLELRQYAKEVMRRVQGAGASATVVIGIWDTTAHFWCAACRRAGLPYYVMVHGVELIVPLYGRLPAWRRHDLTAAAGVIANSHATAALAAARFRLPASPSVVVPAVGSMPPRAQVDAARQRLPRFDEHTPVLLSVGRLVERKGFDLVLRSVAALSARFPDLRYLVAGDGPERTRLERLASDLGIASRVHFLGAVDAATKWAAYEAADLFVMPNRLLGGSDWEGFGIVFLEAAAAGCTAIGGRTGGTGDAISDGRTGVLVDPERPDELTIAIERLLDDDGLRGRLGEAAERRVREEFCQSALAQRVQMAMAHPATA